MVEPAIAMALKNAMDTNHNVYDKLVGDLNTGIGGIVEQCSGQELSVADAFEVRGHCCTTFEQTRYSLCQLHVQFFPLVMVKDDVRAWHLNIAIIIAGII